MKARLLLLILPVAGWALIASVPEAQSEPASGESIGKLITQLGSTNFTARQEASKQLHLIGGPALEALKKATRSADAEVRRRAIRLVAAIESRVERERLLTPSLVKLSFKNTPIEDAVAELARQSKQPLVLGDKVGNRTITLEMGETPFWVALDRFSREAGLVEVDGKDVSIKKLQGAARGPKNKPPKPAKPRKNTKAAVYQGKIALVDGTPPQTQTYYAGAMRIKVLAVAGKGGTAKSTDDILLPLNAAFESQIKLEGKLEARISKAVDDQGQILKQAGEELPAAGQVAFGPGSTYYPSVSPSVASTSQLVAVRLAKGQKATTELKELTGHILGQVRTPPEALVTVDNVLQAVGKTAKGPQGTTLTLKEIVKQAGGQYRVKAELVGTPETGLQNPMIQRLALLQRGGRQIQFQIQSIQTTPSNELSLVDAQGQAFEVSGTYSSIFRGNNQGFTQEIGLVFKAKKGQGEPAKLMYTGSRLVNVEVPFTLKNVKLP